MTFENRTAGVVFCFDFVLFVAKDETIVFFGLNLALVRVVPRWHLVPVRHTETGPFCLLCFCQTETGPRGVVLNTYI